jgi:hypothetical protein
MGLSLYGHVVLLLDLFIYLFILRLLAAVGELNIKKFAIRTSSEVL